MIFYPHEAVQMTMSFTDGQQYCIALLTWTSKSAKMGTLEYPMRCDTAPSFWMLQFKLFEDTGMSSVIIYCENTRKYVFLLNNVRVCGTAGGLKEKTLTGITFSTKYGNLRYTAGALKYDNYLQGETSPGAYQ
jgi:hypothetical protein